LFSFLARKANDIIQAIFGWSVTALFGRLPRRSQVLVTGALLFSLAWPVFVLGVFMPRVAGWALAMVPLHDLIGTTALRIIWLVLAVVAPAIVGILVWIAAPKRRGGIARAIVSGYPAALGFFAAFVVVAVTVPIIKIASIARRWSDEHIYMQPHAGKYRDVVADLAEAAERAGLAVTVADAPGYMVIATTIMRTLAGGAVAPFVSDKLRRIAAPGLEMYLYPADLLLRGEPTQVARVRTMFGRTTLDSHAYLVGSPDAQAMQKELSRQARELEAGATPLLESQLRQLYTRLMHADIPYDDWVILDLLARRQERRLLDAGVVHPGMLPIDSVGDDRAATPSWHPPQRITAQPRGSADRDR
jgi:hypothetical protein